MSILYKDYFNIDPKYYAAVTEQLITDGKVSWKGFYPHETFIKLIKTTYDVLSKKANRSIWVEGAYGTGKSHAALTIKSLLDCSNEETLEYFNDYNLNQDLRDKFIAIKNSGKILTIHRIGSASINNDLELIIAIQESIIHALKKQGIQNLGEISMSDAFIEWVKQPENRDYFNALIKKEEYTWLSIGGGKKSIDDIIQSLEDPNCKSKELLMQDIIKVLKDAGHYGLIKNISQLNDWIKDVIQKNNLEAILFIWDEFSEYLKNHPIGLTGFQTVVELSQSTPFYFMIITHESRNLFSDNETAKKILGRFEPPIKIELPENMAFTLMEKAMKKTSDETLFNQWENEYAPTLNSDLYEVRKRIEATKINISDQNLKAIVPIHPYAAILLKNIATVFNSNQRSMFDFIINNDMEEAKGFKWYINTYGPYDEDYNLLTIDLLWDFFCGKEQNGMNTDVKNIINNYYLINPDKLIIDEQRVLKTILLLQAISLKVAGQELLVPNEQNLDLAFSGLPEWSKGKATSIATGLIHKNFLFKRPIANNKFEYSITSIHGGESIEPYKNKIRDEIKTQELLSNGKIKEVIQIPDSCKLRYKIEETSFQNFKQTIQKVKSITTTNVFKIIATFACNDDESIKLKHAIQNTEYENNDIIFIESLEPMGHDLLEQYIEFMANSKYNIQKDKKQAEHYQNEALKVLQEWYNKIANGAFIIYTFENKSGERIANLESLQEKLALINKQKYYYGVEQFHLTSTLYTSYQLAAGAVCGLTQTLTGAYKSANPKLSIEKALEGAWKIDKYWEKPELQDTIIVKIKKKIDEIIQKGFSSPQGIVSITTILDELEQAPFGLLPSSISALILGFTLKEYATPEFSWTNGNTSETMSIDKMKMMIANALQNRQSPNKNYKDEAIRSMTPEIRNFLNCTIKVFNINPIYCGSIEQARDQLRVKMKELSFPIWCLKSIINNYQFKTKINILEELIDLYCGIVNTANGEKKKEDEYAESIGKIINNNPDCIEELSSLINSNNCLDGMIAYIKTYKDGILTSLAIEINDNGKFINEVKNKFNASDANWVWNQSTANDKIEEVILEYQIIAESNKILEKSSTLKDVISAWDSRTNNIKIPYEVIAKHIGELAPFLHQLYLIKVTKNLANQDKQKFYNLLVTQKTAFDEFYKNQIPYFKKDAESFLEDLTDEEIIDLYNSLPNCQFTKNKSDYYNFIESQVVTFIKNQWRKKLQTLWFENTGTKNPKDWSNHYGVPILCLFNDEERTNIKCILNTILNNNSSENEAQNAYKYLTSTNFFEKIKNEEYQNECFMKRIVKEYAILLTDVKKIKEELRKSLSEEVFNWFDNSTVQNCLKKMADKQYKLSGCDNAMNLIDKMNPDQLKNYLKEKISNDIDFGLQILKGNK